MRYLLPVALTAVLSLALGAGAARGQEMPPAAPTGLTASQVADAIGVISLQWSDNAARGGSYRIERSSSGELGPWELIATVPAGTECFSSQGIGCYSDLGLQPGATYWYRLAAVNTAGMSEYSRVASAVAGTEGFPQPAVTPGFAVAPPKAGEGSGRAVSSTPSNALIALVTAVGIFLALGGGLLASRRR